MKFLAHTFLLLAFFLSSTCFAQQFTGVDINNSRLFAEFGVRHDGSPNKDYVTVSTNSTETFVNISAYSAQQNSYFYCRVMNDSPSWERAISLAHHFENGSWLKAGRVENTCTFLRYGKSTRYLRQKR